MPWFRIACIALIIICVSHLAGHIILVPHFLLINNFTGEIPSNPAETELLRIMNEYKRSVGGSRISMMDIQNGLSLCYSLFFLWTAILNLMIQHAQKRNHRLLARISFVNCLMLALGAAISAVYFFWLPIASFLTAGILFLVSGMTYARSRQF